MSVNHISLDSQRFFEPSNWQPGLRLRGPGSAANTTVAQGEVKFYHSGGNTYVLLNQTADTTADFQIFIDGIHTLTAGNFVGIL